jgi:serine/threonine-protein kinase RsbW
MILRLELTSAVACVDLVQVAGEYLARDAGFDEESVHSIDLAIRESVLNAVTHGNHNDAAKRVFIEFESDRSGAAPVLTIRVRDQGQGFDPGAVVSPLDPENLLKSSGRGIFLIRSFMDDVQINRAAEGGMQIQMTKRACGA